MYKIHLCNDGKAEELTLKWYAVNNNGEVVYESKPEHVYSQTNTSFVALEISQNQVPDGCFIVADILDKNGFVDRAFYKKGALEITASNDRIDTLKTDGENVRVKSNAR